MDDRFVFCLDGSDYLPMYHAMLADVSTRADVTIVETPYTTKRRIFGKTLPQWHRTQEKRLPQLDFTRPWYTLESVLPRIKKEQPVYLILFNASLFNGYSKKYLQSLKKRYTQLQLVMFFVDVAASPLSAHALHLWQDGLIDKAYTVDRADAEKYEMQYWGQLVSGNAQASDCPVETDLYFCGALKSRKMLLDKTAAFCQAQGGTLCFDLIWDKGNRSDAEVPTEGIHVLNGVMPYSEVLAKARKARCILDYTQKGQSALTLRPYEAVLLNRKLLTNNPEIKNFDYYDARYMRLIDELRPEDIAWALQPAVPDYGYKGEYSPIHLLEDLTEESTKDKA